MIHVFDCPYKTTTRYEFGVVRVSREFYFNLEIRLLAEVAHFTLTTNCPTMGKRQKSLSRTKVEFSDPSQEFQFREVFAQD